MELYIPLLYVLNTLCSSGQSAFSKHSAAGGNDPQIFNLNKALAGLAAFLILGLIGGLSFELTTLLLGLGYGLLLAISMYTGFMALATGPMALSSIVASFSLIIPFLFGITLWGESLSVYGIIGMVLLCAAIILLNIRKGGTGNARLSVKWSIYAILTMLANGFGSVIQKYQQRCFPGLYRNEFMIAAMLCVFLVTLVFYLVKPRRTRFSLSVDGIVSGGLNGATSYLMLCLAATQNASVLYPVASVANISAVWLIGRFVFKEKTEPIRIVGLVLGVAAIVLLNLRLA